MGALGFVRLREQGKLMVSLELLADTDALQLVLDVTITVKETGEVYKVDDFDFARNMLVASLEKEETNRGPDRPQRS